MSEKKLLEKNRKRGPGGAPTRATSIPTEANERKNFPIASGVLDYFPDALVAISQISKVGNDQHNPGQSLRWDRNKSGDESDAFMRHFLQRGTMDIDGIRHTAKMAWRILALLQKEIEQEQDELLKEEKMTHEKNPTNCITLDESNRNPDGSHTIAINGGITNTYHDNKLADTTHIHEKRHSGGITETAIDFSKLSNGIEKAKDKYFKSWEEALNKETRFQKRIENGELEPTDPEEMYWDEQIEGKSKK